MIDRTPRGEGDGVNLDYTVLMHVCVVSLPAFFFNHLELRGCCRQCQCQTLHCQSAPTEDLGVLRSSVNTAEFVEARIGHDESKRKYSLFLSTRFHCINLYRHHSILCHCGRNYCCELRETCHPARRSRGTLVEDPPPQEETRKGSEPRRLHLFYRERVGISAVLSHVVGSKTPADCSRKKCLPFH